jgi:hypothetical protein
MKKIILLFLLLPLFLAAQTKPDHTLLSSGPLPQKLLNELQAKITSEHAEAAKMGYTQKQPMDSVIWYDTYLYNLLLSGEVLYGDSLGSYVNKVAAELLKNEPEKLSSLHFYVVRSSFPEVYTFRKGYVFLSTGLIAQLENEAQLAFILAHETAHITLKHCEDLNIKEGLELYNREQYSYVQQLREMKTLRSLAEETAADREAVEMIKASAYSSEGIDLAFELFYYRRLPFDDKPFDATIFNTSSFKLRDTLILKETNPIVPHESRTSYSSEDEQLNQRKKELEMDLPEQGRKSFILPKKEFLAVRENARFALCQDYLADRDYMNAIYTSYLLLKKHPGDAYLQAVISKALYAVTIFKSPDRRTPAFAYSGVPDTYQSDSENSIDLESKEVEGHSQAVYYLFEQIEPPELNVMSILYTWKTYKSSGDKSLKPVLDSLFAELFTASHLQQSSFAKLSRDEQKVQDSIAAISDPKEETKYTRIKSQQASSGSTIQSRLEYAFAELFHDKEFADMYAKGYAKKNRSKAGKSLVDFNTKKKEVPKAVIVDPVFSVYPSRKAELKKESEKITQQRALYTSMLAAEIKKKNLSHVILRPADSLNFSTEEYNDRSRLHRWIIERERNGNNLDALVFGAGDMQSLADKYGTPYFAFCAVRNVDQASDRTDHVFKVYNIVTGELAQLDVNFVNYICTPSNLSMAINACVDGLTGSVQK